MGIDAATSEQIRTVADRRAAEAGCYYDPSAAARPASFFRKFLRHSKGQFAGKPFDLLPWQDAGMMRPLFGWKRPDGTRRFRRSYVEVPKKNGKLLDVRTPIPTPSGWAVMGEMAVGDVVFDERGIPCKVVAISDVVDDERPYELTFADGTSVVAGARHEWVVKCVAKKKTYITTTTERMFETQRYGCSERANYLVDVAGAIATEESTLPIDPYLFGAWIGNGKRCGGDITIRRGDIATVESVCRPMGWSSSWENPGGGSDHYYVPGMRQILRHLGVLENKHIPTVYLRSSIGQRWALLQGLMDTDGCVGSKGQCIYATSEDMVCHGVLELLRSLGFKATHTWVDESDRTDRCSLGYYRILFSADRSCPVSRLDRKQSNLPPEKIGRTRASIKAITKIEPVDFRPLRCIQVDSPSRMYLCGYGFTPTHNSTIAAGVGLHLLIGDGERGAEVYSTASTRDQAKIVHREAVHMVEASSALSNYLRLNRATHTIHFDAKAAFYKAIAAEARASEGLNPNGIIKDELHAWHGNAGRLFFDALKYAGAARQQPMDFQITTAGDDVTSVCYDQHQYAKGILSGAIDDDDRFFAYIAAALPTDDFEDPAVWRKANPSLGVTMSETDFAADLREAMKSPASWSAFLRYRLNVWQAGGRSAISLHDWEVCGADYLPADLVGVPCWAALDLARARDFTALVLLFKVDETKWRVLAWFWLPEASVAAPNTLETIKAWARAKHITATSGNVTDYRQVEDDAAAIIEKYRPVELAFDPMFAEDITQRLADRCGVERVAFPQTLMNYAAPAEEFERIITGQLLQHNRNPVLSWMVGNLCWSMSGEMKRPAKLTPDSPRRIDGAVALIMALGRALVARDNSPTLSFV